MNKFESARSIAHTLLAQYKRNEVTAEQISEAIDSVMLMSLFQDIDTEELQTQLESDFDIYSKDATLLVAEDILPWLSDEKVNIKFDLWNRYKLYMNEKDPSFPVMTLDDLTDKILDKCVNPKMKGSWDRRGMVVGNVQSGKTANYTGLINKATDAGYKLIIVIAGIHNSLRAQTQSRIDEGFIGRKSSDLLSRKVSNKVGVGKYNTDTEIYSFTSTDNNGDFKSSTATRLNIPIGGKSPTVLVIKKNKSILENLISWLYQYANEINGERKIVNVPLLLIDDEADNASVNSGTDLDVKTINRLMRTLLNLFNQNTYIGYTATPYANIFIPATWSSQLETRVKGYNLKVGEDLFPRDFIVNIPPPSNYIGALQVFGYQNDATGEDYEGLDIIRSAEDQEPYFPKSINKVNKEELPDDVPESLKTAIKSFILSCAIRRLRGQENKHNSMLIHVALYVKWIDRIAWLVNEILRDYKNQIHSKQGPLLGELEDLFVNDYIVTTENVMTNLSYKDHKLKQHEWSEVLDVLDASASKIEVKSVHGTKNTRLLEYHNIEDINYEAYPNGHSVIAVGGNRLARGITLEGLSVSYYLRTCRLYDSLMQMGRWFGYRPGYVDLCRLYTTNELVGWYKHVTLATEEMRADFDEMSSRNMKPVDYQLKVRTHPGLLSITSVAKMREHEKIQIGFSGKKIQTYELLKDSNSVLDNYLSLKNLLLKMHNPEIQKTSSGGINGLLWRDIEPDNIICFLESYKTALPGIRADIIGDYIRAQNKSKGGLIWSVKLVLNSLEADKFDFQCGDVKFSGGLPRRSNTRKSGENIYALSKQNILDKSDRRDDLNLTEKNPSEKLINQKRAEEKKALLVIYPLSPSDEEQLDQNIPLVGWGLIFPQIENEQTVEYAARIIHGADDSEDDDDTEDENED